ncbi:Segregation and condensation protein B [Pirellula sp. SH-Sr6A]|uniref:SMC-Scp complex subunit ScpB n=1 Tax=Pirellula sp. SH-Sr6A TaxID=1632865 RepID=UPI00078C3046|nr:SMC-Scp complex subunit ScpB [Pirellula sp. SH-Sr6A]AMV32710.1 Segregation and condensation protein B [Pirellula sp. SH-Sr6A]
MVFGRKIKKIEPLETELAEVRETEDQPDVGLSLEDLGNAYARAMEERSGVEASELSASVEDAALLPFPLSPSSDLEETLAAPEVGETDHVPVTTETVLESILFLGTPDSRPIDVERLQSLFRNMPREEIDEAVGKLNQKYRQQGRAFEIVFERGGYRLQLAEAMSSVRERFYGKVKEVQLPQSAIDCLALVAYQPGISREQVESLWGQPPHGTLNMLVRKGLLRVEREGNAMTYYTTDRFLEVVGVDSIDDLPREEL